MSYKTCTHIKVNGVRCQSPALREEQFCYFHQRMLRGVRTPPQARLHPIANLEDPESIQASLMEVINALMRNTIDVKRAALILRALHIAVKNAQRVRFAMAGYNMVRQIPDYPESKDGTSSGSAASRSTAPSSMELPAVAATPYKPVDDTDPEFWENCEEGARELARRAAETRAAAQSHVGTPGPPEPPRAQRGDSNAADHATTKTAASASDDRNLPPRKPPIGLKHVESPKERKTKVHR